MEENGKENIKLDFDALDIEIVNNFRKKKDTSVLTVMFTDIKGFTHMTEEKGDAYANKVRNIHDEILTKTIEEKEVGKVLKKIGDSVMAIFSEPSVAVEKALVIQERLRRLNKDFQETDKIKVRIGLNMGQVTVEDNVSMDVFGQVVNRAARIKEMADGGHIYVSYTVFDSARTWLIESKPGKYYEWKLHGQYFVKGVNEPLAIYEVFDKNSIKPKPPSKGVKKRSLPKLITSVLLVISGIVITLAVIKFESTTVIFRYVNLNTKLFMDDNKEIILDGEMNKELRDSLTKIPVGDHIIYYDVSYVTRYYAEINIKRGKNIIEPRFKYNGMPGFSRYLTYTKDGKNRIEESAQQKYLIYDKNNKKREVTVDMHMVIEVRPDDKTTGKYIFDYYWGVTLDGKQISQKHVTDDNTGAGNESKYVKSIIHEDNYHYYYANYRISEATTELSIGAAYIEYK
ncbi:MAG: adenylate/guanylate cyclase domain-containing protein [Planctomycetota bacterium]